MLITTNMLIGTKVKIKIPIKLTSEEKKTLDDESLVKINKVYKKINKLNKDDEYTVYKMTNNVAIIKAENSMDFFKPFTEIEDDELKYLAVNDKDLILTHKPTIIESYSLISYLNQIKKQTVDMKAIEKHINMLVYNIQKYEDGINNANFSITTDKKKLKLLKSNFGNVKKSDGKMEKEMKGLERNKKIKSIKAHEYNNSFYLIIETYKLKYKSSRIKYNQGNFWIIYNLTDKTLFVFGNKPFKHNINPCISSGGSVCYGSLEAMIKEERQANNICNVINETIIFLQEPNYRTPYESDLSFKYAQQLGKIFDKDIDMIEEPSNVLQNIQNKFDISLYTKTLEEEKKAKKIITDKESEDSNLPF